jgi:RsiW-degrading membrane proteinase PrsW (M82 family)
MEILAALFFGFAPMFFFAWILYWLDRYEKEPILLLGAVFAWGMLVAAGGAYILNSAFGLGVYVVTGDPLLTDITTATLSAPLVEEGLKGLAVLLVFLIFRKEFDSVLDGIVYAGIAALGFAATENSLYIWRGYQESGWDGLWTLVFIRVILVGWQHPVYTAFTGMGLAIARNTRSCLVRAIAPLAGIGLAMFTHGFHNFLASVPFLGDLTCLLGTFLDWTGVFFMFIIILWAGWMEGNNIARQLREEAQLGIISPAQYRTASSSFAQGFATLTALISGKYFPTVRFYQVCGELAHKKQQLIKVGDESGNSIIIQKYRDELARLSPNAQA